jgi:hypothetical protein
MDLSCLLVAEGRSQPVVTHVEAHVPAGAGGDGIHAAPEPAER